MRSDSWVVRRLRPVRERLLGWAYSERGMPRTVNGIPMRVHPQHRWYFTAAYDSNVAAYFAARVRPGAVCLNVGANLGVYALQFAHWSAPGGRVFAFEPNPDTAGELLRHVRMNGLTDRVEVVQKAVADQPGTATFHVAGTDGMSRLGEPNPLLDGQSRSISVEVDTIDRFCDATGIIPDALMIDVEGFEAAALAGAAQVLTGRGTPPAVVVEFHPNAWPVAGTDRAAVEALLTRLGVRSVPLSGQSDPFAEYGHVALEPIGRQD